MTNPDSPLLVLPDLSVTTAALVARGFRGTVHGDTADGEVDIEFPDARHAASFAHHVAPCWIAKLRKGDAITDLDSWVTLTVTDARRHT